MANLKEIRSRIASVNSTKQITSAMKMVSAAKLRRAQDNIVQMRPYAQKMEAIMSNVSSSLDPSENEYASPHEIKRVLIVAFTSNRGLCGGFNNNVLKQVNQLIDQHKGLHVKVLSVGKKAYDFYKKRDQNAGIGYPEHPYEIYGDLNFEDASRIAEAIMLRYRTHKVDKVVLVYNAFKNAATQELRTEQFLPIVPPKQAPGETQHLDFLFEPNKEAIIRDLIPKSLKTQFFKALLDSFAAEHGARMTAMHKATDNASDLIKSMKLSYNKARQSAITGEILEIVGGAEALAG